MPFAEFQNGNAGLALADFSLRSQDAYASMMDRAQRRKFAQEEFDMKKQEFAANMATTSIQQDSLRAELAKRKIDFTEAERKANNLATLREQFAGAGGAAQLEANTKVIREMKDPMQMRRAASALRAAYSKFATDPETHKIIEEQLGSLEPVIAETEKSKINEKFNSGMWARSREEAMAMFPGQLIQPMVDPSSGATLFVAEEKPDPMMERRALSMLRVAAASGDPVKIESVLQDPVFSTMMGAAGSRVSDEYFKTMQAAAVVQQKREANERARQDQDMQNKKFGMDQNALSVSGYSGSVKTEAEAKEFRKEQTEMGNVLAGIGEVRRLGKEYLKKNWSSDPLKKIQLQKLAEQQVGMIVGALRIPITGPGAMTDDERKFIERLNGNPTKIFSLSDDEFAKLDAMEAKFNAHLDLKASNIGLGPRTGKKSTVSSGPVSGSRAQAIARGASGSP